VVGVIQQSVLRDCPRDCAPMIHCLTRDALTEIEISLVRDPNGLSPKSSKVFATFCSRTSYRHGLLH